MSNFLPNVSVLFGPEFDEMKNARKNIVFSWLGMLSSNIPRKYVYSYKWILIKKKKELNLHYSKEIFLTVIFYT